MKRLLLTQRQKKLIDILYAQRKSMVSDELGELLEVSTRTIRNDVKNINLSFREQVIISDKDGYYLNQKALIDEEDVFDPSKQADERYIKILQELLINGDGQDMDELAERFYVSKPVLEKDIRSIQSLLNGLYSLRMVRKKNKLYLEGDEKEKRKCISHFIYDEYSKNFITMEKIQEFFPHINVKLIETVINKQLLLFHINFDKWSKLSLILHFVIAINWIEKNPSLAQNKVAKGTAVSKDSDEDFIISVTKELEECFSICFPEDEKRYIGYLVKGRKVKQKRNETVQRYFKKIIHSTCQLFALEIQEKSVDLLSLHMENALRRIKSDTSIYNPFMNDVKEKAPMMYEVAVRMCEKIRVDKLVCFDDNEIGFIALHLACALLHFQEEKLTGGIYFPQYHAFRENIYCFLQEQVGQKVNLMNIEDASEAYWEDIDFIITPLSFYSIADKPVVGISIIPDKQDLEKIQETIRKIEEEKKESRIKEAFLKLFDERLFLCAEELSDREDILMGMCNEMERLHIVNKGFYENVKAREEISPTGFNNMFALPHALHPDANISKISVVLLKKPVMWGHCEVRLILLFAIDPLDESNLMVVYERIIRSLNNGRHIRTLIKAENYQEFINTFLSLL